jgi:hypothetical protein
MSAPDLHVVFGFGHVGSPLVGRLLAHQLRGPRATHGTAPRHGASA